MSIILAIDDQLDNLISLKAVIKTTIAEAEVISTQVPTEGIQLAIEKQPDVIVLDIIMPDMDGYEVCRILKKDVRTRHIPIMLVTAIRTDTSSRVRGLDAGADAFLSKPIEPAEISSQIKVLLRIKKAEDKLRDKAKVLASQKQEALSRWKESERRLDTLINNLDGMAYRCLNDHSWTMVFMSDAFSSITGYPVESILNNRDISYNDLIHPEDRDIVWEHVQQSIANKSGFNIQYRLIIKSGKILRVIEKGRGVFSEDGALIGIEGFIMDVTSQIEVADTAKKLSVAVNSSSSIVMITNISGIIEFVNSGFSKVTGYQEQEVVGKKSNLLRFHDSEQNIDDHFWEKLLEGDEWNGTFHNKKKNGTPYWEAATISAIRDEQGKIVNFIKIAEDITKQKEADQRLKESEQRYRRLIETTSEGFWLIDANGKTLEVNQSLMKILGYTDFEMIGRKPFDFVNKENKIIFENQISSASNRKHRIYEITLTHKDGRQLPCRFNATSLEDSKGNFLGSFAFVSDISNQKRSENVQQMLYNIANAVNTTDSLSVLIGNIEDELRAVIESERFDIVLFEGNTQKKKIELPTDSDMISEHVGTKKSLAYYVFEQHEPALLNRDQMFELQKKGMIEFFDPYCLLWMGVPMAIDDRIIGVITVQSNTNENAFTENDMKVLEFVSDQVALSIDKKKSEQTIKDALSKAEESDKLKSAFLATMSHELRTPLNAIIGFSDLIKSGSYPMEMVLEFVTSINDSGVHLLDIVEDIFDISLIESGQIKVENESIKIETLLHQIKDLIKLEEERHNKEGLLKPFEIDNKLRDLKIITDPGKLKQIMLNLLKNALKFTNEGSVQCIIIEHKENNKDYLMFCVEDTGIGIQEENLESIFDIFRQIDDSVSRKYGGTGIGLSISKKLVHKLGGDIWVESELGKGSKFYFTIELNVDPVQEEVNNNHSVFADFSGKNILVVEDVEFSYELLEVLLRSCGANVLWAENGQEAVDIVTQNNSIDLILMDINMPVMNGFDATKKIVEMGVDIPIIAQTAYAISGDRTKAIEIGCVDYITKPIVKERLFKILSKYL